MKGDFSKDTFDRQRHYSSVRLQQGRVVTDADWNEEADLTRYRSEREAWDVIGGCGGPESTAGFALSTSTVGLAVSAIGDDAWIACEDGTILRSLDGGATWTRLDAQTTTPLRGIRFVDANVGWIIGDGGFIAKTSNAGATWTRQQAPLLFDPLAIAAIDSNLAWIVGDSGTVLRTTDGGVTWLPTRLGGGRIYAVQFLSATVGWIAGQDGQLWSTIDGGITWTARTTNTTNHLRAIAFADANTGWVVGNGGTILKSTNGGVAWTPQDIPGPTLHAVAVRTGVTEVWAVGDAGMLLKTTNGGAAWQMVDAGQGDEALHGIAIGSAAHGWIVGEGSLAIHLANGNPVQVPLPRVGLSIGAGRYYVHGVICEADAVASFYNQPDRVVADRLEPGTHLVYLDVWQRHISTIEDPSLREVALGGPDTTTRGRTVWQVRTLPLGVASPSTWNCVADIDDWTALTAKPTARLRARSEPEQIAASLCELGAAGGFRRVENQLYRVEVHEGGSTPTFKWSRENGSVAFAIVKTTENAGQTTVTLASRGQDANLDLVENGWVEVVDDDATLEHGVGLLRRFVGAGDDPLEILLDGVVGTTGSRPTRHPLLRRWDHRPAGTASAMPIQEGQWIALEDGVEVWFDPGGQYRPGDYWQIPARTITADVEWPRDEHGAPIAKPPAGIEHGYCRLGVIEVAGDGSIEILSDCRNLFPPLTGLIQLEYVGGDGQDGIPGQPLPQRLRVRVRRGKTPVENAVVRFDVIAGLGTLTGAPPGGSLDVLTDAEGLASCEYTLGNDIDPAVRHERIDAMLLDAASDPIDAQQITFAATGTLSLEYVSGDGQQAAAAQQLAHALEVRVANGQEPVPGRPVFFAVTEGGGALIGANPAITAANGVASIRWRLGHGGTQRVEAEIRRNSGARVQHVGFNGAIAESAGGGCEVTVGPGGMVSKLPENLDELFQQFGDNLCLCLRPGLHKVEGLKHSIGKTLSIHACDIGSVLQLSAPAIFQNLASVDLSGFRLESNANAGVRFVKCGRVTLRTLVGLMPPATVPMFEIQSTQVVVDGCLLTAADNADLRGVVITIAEGTGGIWITNNQFIGAVSLYGPPTVGQEMPLQLLQALLGRFAGLNAPLKSLDETTAYVAGNSFRLLTIGSKRFGELVNFANGQGDPPANLIESGLFSGNVIHDRRSIALARQMSVSGTSLMVERKEPLTILVADTATVSNTVYQERNDSLRVFAVTRKGVCAEVGNIPFVVHN